MYEFGWSLQIPWLWWVYVLFVTMMWHGAFYWTAEADELASKAENGRACLPRCADWMMTLHGLLFVVIFAIAFSHSGATRRCPIHAARQLSGWSTAWTSCPWLGEALEQPSPCGGVVGLLICGAFKLGNCRKKLPS